jgi:hypothetical protein
MGLQNLPIDINTHVYTYLPHVTSVYWMVFYPNNSWKFYIVFEWYLPSVSKFLVQYTLNIFSDIVVQHYDFKQRHTY